MTAIKSTKQQNKIGTDTTYVIVDPDNNLVQIVINGVLQQEWS